MFSFAILNPKGFISTQQYDLIILTFSMMLLAVIPVLIMLYSFAWKYREGKKSKYTPNWEGNFKLQATWGLLLLLIVIVLAITAWKSSHSLDPRKPIPSSNPPITIQVVALEWKWLFIYPDQNVAMINFLQIPEDTPIKFEITADAPMNSFWVPQLGSQMYAMSGMKTKLNMMAEEIGEYRGQSSNISGEGFSDMTFIVKATSKSDFDEFINYAKASKKDLNQDEYTDLAQPAVGSKLVYSSVDPNLFESIVNGYMPSEHPHTH